MMRWRNSYFWALGVCVALVVLVLTGHPSVTLNASGAVSAPFAPSASVESAPVGQVLLSHFDWSGHALRSIDLSLALRAIRVGEGASQVAGASRPHYGPLHRRPPPSFS